MFITVFHPVQKGRVFRSHQGGSASPSATISVPFFMPGSIARPVVNRLAVPFMVLPVCKRSQPAGARRVPQLAQGLAFNLANAFARDLKLLAHFFQRMLGAVLKAKTHPDDFLLTRIERPETVRRLSFHLHPNHGFRESNNVRVMQE